ncbi:hypothetical protein CPB85DRAFT_1262973 [Mucidula mucida]|nr:hypothetical protein CPB85DRAFT_1262973 [Mucidula mucida]
MPQTKEVKEDTTRTIETTVDSQQAWTYGHYHSALHETTPLPNPAHLHNKWMLATSHPTSPKRIGRPLRLPLSTSISLYKFLSLASFCPPFNLSNADLELRDIADGQSGRRRDVPITEGLLQLTAHSYCILLATSLHIGIVYEFYAYDHHALHVEYSRST